jgi:hypothetical protein
MTISRLGLALLATVTATLLAACSQHPPAEPGQTRIAPTGMGLRPSGNLLIKTDGTVVDGLDINGTVTVAADNVTVRNSRITVSAPYGILVRKGATGTTIEDVEIKGLPGCAAGIAFERYTARRVDIHGCADGAKSGEDTIIEDSWIHDLRITKSSHNDGIQHSGGSNAAFLRNRIDDRAANTAIFISPDLGPIGNVTVEGNRLGGGNWTLHLEGLNIVVRNNRFGRNHEYGLAAITGTITQDGNVWADTGEPLLL